VAKKQDRARRYHSDILKRTEHSDRKMTGYNNDGEMKIILKVKSKETK
jgi:hypothetical protein